MQLRRAAVQPVELRKRAACAAAFRHARAAVLAAGFAEGFATADAITTGGTRVAASTGAAAALASAAAVCSSPLQAQVGRFEAKVFP